MSDCTKITAEFSDGIRVVVSGPDTDVWWKKAVDHSGGNATTGLSWKVVGELPHVAPAEFVEVCFTTDESGLGDRLGKAREEILPLLYKIMGLKAASWSASPEKRAVLDGEVGRLSARLDSLVLITMLEDEA